MKQIIPFISGTEYERTPTNINNEMMSTCLRLYFDGLQQPLNRFYLLKIKLFYIYLLIASIQRNYCHFYKNYLTINNYIY